MEGRAPSRPLTSPLDAYFWCASAAPRAI